MWSFAAIASIGVFAYFTFRHWQKRRWMRHTVDRRRAYLQSVARLEALVVRLNAIEKLCVGESLKEQSFLNHFEACLTRTEALLQTMLRVPPTARDGRLLSDLKPLIAAGERQLDDLESRMRQLLGNQTIYERWTRQQSMPVRGCYFCSRPYRKSQFLKLRIKLKDERQVVWVCQECRAELKSKGEVPTLYFKQDGKSVHWSQNPNYDPFRDFASLQQHKPRIERQNVQLSLVRSEQDSSDSGS